MPQSLIRPEVVAARRQQWLGEVRLGLPSLQSGLIGLMAATALVLLLLLCLGSYTRRTSVIGQIVPDAGLLRLDASAAGVISALYVDEGSSVVRGQTLLLIDVDQSSATMGGTASLIADQLSTQVKRVDRNAQLATQDALRSAQALQQQLVDLGREQSLMQVQRALRARQLDQAKAALARVSPLQQSGVLARRQIEEYEQAQLSAEDALNETDLRILAQQRKRHEVSEQLARLPAQTLTRDTQLRGEQSALTQALAQTEARRVLRVIAPCDGIVTGLSVQPGQSVSADWRLLSMIPAKSRLVAELWVPGSTAAHMAPGDHVLLRIDAFPYQRYGQIRAIVEQVAATALGPAEIRRIADRAPDNPAFRVIAGLPDPGRTLPVRASMSLIGDVQLERRRLIQWLYAPLSSAFGADP